MNWRRIWALILRYTFLLRRSPPRQIEILFWPLMELLVWGFLTLYLRELNPGGANAMSFLLGAMIFWDVLFRAQQGVTLSFLEDIWSRNLLNVFISPVSRVEFAVSTSLVGLIKTTFIIFVLWLVALLFYGFNLGTIGAHLPPLLANLFLMGWSLGLFTTGLILRWGQAAENLAWAVPFLIQPISAVFYPVSVLPLWLQPVAWALPSTYVFEGMRAVLQGGHIPAVYLVKAFGLNLVFLALAAAFFAWMFEHAREHGLLAKIGTQ
jgi:ABC-2 type transport system permease protein